MLLVGRVLVFAALGISVAALNSEVAQGLLAIPPLGRLVVGIGQLVPYVLVISAFTFFYLFVPNTHVRFAPAFAAGVLGGVLWQPAGWGFAVFVASSTRPAEIYSSFAILVLFLFWLYVSWLVLPIGAAVSFYLQHPEYLYAMPGEPRLSNRMRERLAIAIMHRIGSHFVRGEPPWTLHQLTRQLAVPMHAVDVVLGALLQAKIVKQSNDVPPSYLPARDLVEVPVADLLAAVRKASEARFLNPELFPLPRPIEELVTRIDGAIAAAAEGISIRALVDASSQVDRSDEPASDRVSW